MRSFVCFCCCLMVPVLMQGQTDAGLAAGVKVSEVAEGWARNSVNTVIFRKNSLTTFGQTQFIAFYDDSMRLVLGKRNLDTTSQWTLHQTQYLADATDAHRSISIMVDGEGFLHVAWGQHNDSLNYARSVAPLSLEPGPKRDMTGLQESRVSYPEFYRQPDGGLYFFYRDGESGNGSLVIKSYDPEEETWTNVHSNLIDGESQRNAYWQTCVDAEGTIHLSWVWRETWDVATNHDLCYARSRDGGQTWENSAGEPYQLPITQATAEIALHIPQHSELINQTSMTTDPDGNPVIAGYWRPDSSGIPQYQVVYPDKGAWHTQQVSKRSTPFSLSGGGTKQIPISRPQILLHQQGDSSLAVLVFRDAERGNRPSAFLSRDFPHTEWQVMDLSDQDLGAWEPTYDSERWKANGALHLFVQRTVQVDGEGLDQIPPQMIQVLEWTPDMTH